MLLGNIAQQLYNTADTVIVGMYVGDNALSAVGSASPILNLLLALFVGIATGAGIVISQSFGARDREGLSKNIGNCITLTLIATVFIMVFGPMITRPMLELLDTPVSIIDWCASYLNIFFWGSAGFFFYNMLSGVLRGLGDSMSALGFLLLAAALNVVLDLLFVAGFQMGVPGVALATVIAQAISAVFCFIKLMRMGDIFDLNRSTIRFDKEVSGRIIRIGVPSGVTQAIMAGSMMVVQSLTNSMGEMVIAANVIIMRVDGFAMMPNFTFGMAATTFAGQNIGARRLDRVEQGTNAALKLALGVATLLTLCLLFFGEGLMRMFTSTEMIVSMGVRSMRIIAVGYICFAASQVLSGVMRGAGETMSPMWISIVTTFVLRLPIAYLWAHFSRSPQWPNGSPDCLYVSLLISWTLGAVLTFLVFKKGSWRKKMLLTMQDSADVSA